MTRAAPAKVNKQNPQRVCTRCGTSTLTSQNFEESTSGQSLRAVTHYARTADAAARAPRWHSRVRLPTASATYISRERWTAREAQKWRANGKAYTKQPFPAPLVNTFLVSKTFFVAAARVWAGNQSFEHGFDFCNQPDMALHGVVPAFARVVTVPDRWWLRWTPELVTLRQLTVNISDEVFECIEDEVIVWEDALEDGHFQQVVRYHTCFDRPNLLSDRVEVHLHANPLPAPNRTATSTTQWEANVASFGSYLRKHRSSDTHGTLDTTEPSRCSTDKARLPIYHKSAVLSEMHVQPPAHNSQAIICAEQSKETQTKGARKAAETNSGTKHISPIKNASSTRLASCGQQATDNFGERTPTFVFPSVTNECSSVTNDAKSLMLSDIQQALAGQPGMPVSYTHLTLPTKRIV